MPGKIGDEKGLSAMALECLIGNSPVSFRLQSAATAIKVEQFCTPNLFTSCAGHP